MRVHPEAIRSGHQRPSGAISGHQRLSEITCSSDIRRRARAIAMLFERFGSISWTVSFFALEGVAGVAAALASSLVSERPRVSPDEGSNQGPDEGGNQGLHVSHLMRGAIRDLMRGQSGRPRVSPSPNVDSNCLGSKIAWASSTTSFSSQIVSATCNDAWLS